MGGLTEIFTRIYGPDVGLSAANLERALQSALREARAAWPDVQQPDDVFIARIAAGLPRNTPVDQCIQKLSLADLYLASACSSGNPRAIEALELAYLPPVASHLRSKGFAPDQVSEILQLLREKLLMGGKLASYSGRGALRGWLRVAAVRIALNQIRKTRREESLGSELDMERSLLGSAPADPETELLKATYGAALGESLKEAFHALQARSMSILHQHYVGGLNMIQLAAAHRVHRVTAARWLAGATEELRSELYKALGRRVNLPPSHLDSILGLVVSRLSYSLRKIPTSADPA